MDPVQRMLIEHECAKLTVLYCRHLDHLDPDAFAAIYTEDAVYKPAVEPVPIEGRAAIRDWIGRYPKDRLGRHVATNQIVEVIDEDSATGSSYAIVFREPAPREGVISDRVTPRSLVEYSDSYRRTAEGWKIARRVYRFDFLQGEEARRPGEAAG
ncbi:nuclear transport factor 2 family protein [Salipiger bermudensis]|uniref:nuclear transport factor 2 family protein n=1 Tax=Salipiger bermudensis TaxID=344736 RepID=UPI001A9071D6|nr:nuclear transport factor 2 family protein [Salipiger bermudensis]MBN9675680.1 nuclear transport factor 2 family protein [Salipiger bermudensis]